LNRSRTILRKEIIGWSLYDFANTIFSMNILSLYFKRWIVEDLGRDGLYYDLPYAGSMLIVGLIMPALGAISDHSGKKRILLFLFTVTCCLAIGSVPLVPINLLAVIILLFVVANFFYEGGMVFYNSLLYSVSSGYEARLISGLGVALGYTGSLAGMILVLPWVTGQVFALDVPWLAGSGKAGAFAPTAVLFFVFSVPTFLWVKERSDLVKSGRADLKKAYREVWEALRNTRRYPGVLRFLIADHFFEDAVVTVILNMGIFSSVVLGFDDANLTFFMLVSTTSAMFGSLFIGRLAQIVNLKKLMMFIILGWIVTLSVFLFVENLTTIYILGSVIGVVLGGLWTVSRPFLAEMVPKDELGRFFGLYSLSGRSAAVVGPVLWGLTVYFFAVDRLPGSTVAGLLDLNPAEAEKLPYRAAIISIIIMMTIGLILFRKIPWRAPEERKDIA